MAWRVALVVGWMAAIVGLVALPGNPYLTYGVLGALVTVAAGALADRWWMAAVPGIVTVLLVGGMFLLIGGCDDDCGGDDGFFAIAKWFLLLFTLPATAAMALGVAGRRLARRDSPPPGPRAPSRAFPDP